VKRPTHMVTVFGVLVAVLAGACSDASGEAGETTQPGEGGGPVANACPPEGCEITIVDVEAAGDEVLVTWEANFEPDISRNHIHVYWDIYTADQVSDDAEDRGVTQGDWHPTDAYPTYTTGSAVSVANRGDSTTLCVTAADRNHVVLDSSIVDCRDVSSLLG
jgi:hypothetical protein